MGADMGGLLTTGSLGATMARGVLVPGSGLVGGVPHASAGESEVQRSHRCAAGGRLCVCAEPDEFQSADARCDIL